MTESTVVQPLLTAAMLSRLIVASGLSLVAGFLGKMVWDYFTGGRVEKVPVFMTRAACQVTREHCSGAKANDNLKTYMARTDTRLDGIDRRIDESSGDIKAMRKDISEIKSVSAASNAILETIQRGIEKRTLIK